MIAKVLCCRPLPKEREQMLVGGCTVWALRWVEGQLPSHLKPFREVDAGDVGSGVIVREANGFVDRASPLNLICKKIQLLAVQLCNDDVVGWQKFKPQHALAV